MNMHIQKRRGQDVQLEIGDGYFSRWASQVAQWLENLPTDTGDLRDVGSIPGSERPPGGGHGSPPQCPCLENPMDRGAWRAAAQGVTKSQTRAHTARLNW